MFNLGIYKSSPFPLRWKGIKSEAKQLIRVFIDARNTVFSMQFLAYLKLIYLPSSYLQCLI